MNDGLVWFLLGIAVGVGGTTLFFVGRPTRQGEASTTGDPAEKRLTAAVNVTGETRSQKVVSTHRSAFRIGASDIEIDGAHYRSLGEIPESTRGLVADELRLARDLLPPDGPQRALVDAFLADDAKPDP